MYILVNGILIMIFQRVHTKKLIKILRQREILTYMHIQSMLLFYYKYNAKNNNKQKKDRQTNKLQKGFADPNPIFKIRKKKLPQ